MEKITTLKAKDMRSIAFENNKDALIGEIRKEKIDPIIQDSAKKGRYDCFFELEEKYEPYKNEIQRSLIKDGFKMTHERMHPLGRKQIYKISWV